MPAYRQPTVALLNFCQSSKTRQHRRRRFCACAQITGNDRLFARESFTDVAKDSLELSRRKLVAQHVDQSREDGKVRLRKHALRLHGQLIHNRGTTSTGPNRSLVNEPVPLECGEVRSDGIVGDAERRSKVLDGPPAATELADHLASCCFRESHV